ncbi:MAG: ferritin-like domain-containing protein [Candidatus Puniceispirillum sp.]
MNPSTLTGGIVDCIATQNAVGKARNTRALVAEWRSGNITEIGESAPPDRPGRPLLPELRPPRDVPKRRITGGVAGRVALIHAIAHIELNAIDLALDMACRYTDQSLPRDFYHDWLSVADDEARHFLMLNDRLALLDAQYGDLPAHDGLWQAAQETAHDFMGRLAVVPMVLEARGLDVTPTMINKLNDVGDHESATALGIIMHDEVGHVLIGKRWFDYVCGMHRRDPVSSWHMLVKRYFKGPLKPPFNIEAREAAHFSAAFYGPLSYRDDLVSTPTDSK